MKMNTKNKYIIMFVIFFLIAQSLPLAFAELDLRITTSFSNMTSRFIAQTDAEATSGYDYGYDAVLKEPPSNYTKIYSIVDGNQLEIDIWNYSSNSSRQIILKFETLPASLTDYLALSWTFSDTSNFDATIGFCGTDNSCSSPTQTTNMESSSSLTSSSTITTSQANYLKLVVSYNPPSSGGNDTGGPDTGGGGCINECVLGAVQSTCTSNTSYKTIECGNYSGKCTTWSSGTTTECPSDKKCDAGECILKCNNECNSEGQRQCYSSGYRICQKDSEGCFNWGNVVSCGLDEVCSDGNCTDLQTCADTCASKGYNCGTPILCGVFGSCGTCSGGYVCNESIWKCGLGEKPNNVPETVAITGKLGCEYNFRCGEWSECTLSYDIESFITGQQLSAGTSSRTCIDLNDCKIGFVETRNCSLKEYVSAEKKKWCNKDYIELLDKDGKVVARIEQGKSGLSYVNVFINVNGKGYCYYCHDGVKNYDEEGVDCGGSCDSCGANETPENIEAKKNFLSKILEKYKLIAYIILGVLALAAVMAVYYFIKILDRDKFPLDERKIINLLGKYKTWGSKGYDTYVLKKPADSLINLKKEIKPGKTKRKK